MNRSLRITLTSLAALLATVTLTAPAFAAIDMFIKFDAKGPHAVVDDTPGSLPCGCRVAGCLEPRG